MNSQYIAWLQKQGIPLFKSNDTYWQLYNRALIPASIAPNFLELSSSEAKDLLRQSGAWFLRYTSNPTELETSWWYIVCDSHDPKRLSSKLRNQIKHGKRHCVVERVEADWFAEHGYRTYHAAHDRYSNAHPMNPETFRVNVLGTMSGPVEYWGVFVGKELEAYCQCTIDNGAVDTTVTRFHPGYLRLHTAHAMISCLIDHYVDKQGMALSNGQRSVAHETNFQDFLLKFGFRKRFCRVNVIYQPWLKSVIQVAFPFRPVLTRFPDRGILHKLRALLVQEEITRLCG